MKPAAHATSTSDVAETGQDGEDEDEDSDEDEEEEEEKAPFQLLGEVRSSSAVPLKFKNTAINFGFFTVIN